MNLALRILLVVWLGYRGSARAEDLLVLERSPTDHAASERLRELHDEPALVREDTEASAPAHAIELGRALGARRVVVFDGASVSLFETASGEQVTRSTPDNTPYTAAFVAAELLALRPAPAPPALPPPRLRFAMRFGAQAWLDPPFPVAPRADLGVALQHARWRAELFALVPGHSEHAGVRRNRGDLGLRASAFVLTHERFRLAIDAQIGAAWTRARLDEPGLLTRTRSALSLGVGLEPSLTLTPWLSLYGLATLHGSTPRAEYRVAGEPAARDSPLGVSFGVGLWLSPPFR